jgi:26S proteasome regulatory subunit T3
MADAMVENPINILQPHKRTIPSSIPNVDSLEGFSIEGSDDYQTYKKLQAQLE